MKAEFSFTACAPPRCSCPTLSVEKDDDGNHVVWIEDDNKYLVRMTPDEMAMIARKFLEVYDAGVY